MQHVAQTSESDIKLESEINNVPKVGNSSTPNSLPSTPCSPRCTPPDTPPDRSSDSFQCFSDTSESGDEDISEVDSFIIDADELTDEAKARISSKLLSSADEGSERTVDPETQARLQSLLKAAGINKFTAGDGKQLADPEVLRRLTSSVSCALDEAAAALTRMRSDSRQANKRALIKACTQGNVTAVRKLLKQGISVNETSDEGESLLSLACSAGYYELAQVLLAMHASVEDRGSKGECTPLMEASSAGFVDIVRLLLAHGADVNAQSATGNTPLMYACASGHIQTIRVLLDAGANVEDHNENGHTPLMEAASAGHVEVAKMLLKHGAGINTHSNEFKESALTLACYKGHLEMVNFLLQAGADQEHKTDEMHTALMEASMDGHVEVAKLLLDSGAQVNMPTDSFESPLTLAACGGHVELAVLLIDRGANIEEVNDEGYTPLMEAAREGHEDMVAILLQRGARINAQTEETQETALTLACCGGFIEVADYLIKQGADLELGASTPLMEAAQEGHLELVRYLLEAGANVHAHTQTADTALTYACENGHTDVADLLLQYGAHLEHESEGGRTPLMKACRAGHLCTVQFLVSKNADINRRTTNNDHTPLSLACAGGHYAIVQFLLNHGADMFHKLKDNSTMLIEAAKGGHATVVKLLLDYPDSCNTNVDNNGNVAASSETCAVTNTTATATQTGSVPTTVTTEVSKNVPTSATRNNNTAFPNVSNSNACISNENQTKAANAASRQIASVLPKTAMRKLSRDPRLVDWRSTDIFHDADGKRIADAEYYKKDESQIPKNSAKQLSQQLQKSLQQLKQQTVQEQQQVQEQQAQQVESLLEQQQLEQQFQEKLTLSSNVDSKIMQTQLIAEEFQRVEQEMKESIMNNTDVSNSSSSSTSKEVNGCRGIIGSMDPLFPNNINNTNSPVIPLNIVSMAAGITNTDTANLPPPPPLIPLSEVLQSTAISDRPKAKPTKKEGKILRKQHLHNNHQQQPLLQFHQQMQQQQLQGSQQTSSTSSRQMNSHEEQVMQSTVYQAAIQQQQSQALHLKQLAQINAQLQQQVIKNQQQIELHQQQQHQQQQLLQQQQPQQQQSPQLIGSGTITVTTNAPNLADIFNHQELLAQIQQMDSNFAKTFPDFAEKAIEKEMRAMQQESLQRCHFLTSISEDEVSLEDVTNGTINVEEKRLCDVHPHSNQTFIETTIKSPIEKHNYSAGSNDQIPADTDNQTNHTNVNADQNCIQLFTMPVCTTIQQPQSQLTLPVQQQQPLQQLQQQQLQQQQELQQPQSSTSQTKQKQQSQLKQMLPSTQQQMQQLKQQQQQQQQQRELQQQKQKPLQFQPQKQLLLQKQQIQHHFQQLQKFPSQKQQATVNNSDSLTLNSPSRQDLHRQLNEMKAIAQSAAVHQNQNIVAKCGVDSVVSHTATSTQTTVATMKKKIPFDDATGTLTKLAIGKKMRAANSRVPPNSGAHAKDDGNNASRVPATNTPCSQNSSMDVDSETESNHDTALTVACAGGHDELVELLLSRGADIEHRDKKGFTPLILAATAGHEKVVDLLLNHNADIEAQSERTKDTPLSLACSGGRYEVVDLLIKRGANKEHRNVSDYTPLSLAASGGYVNIIKLLLQHGAEINSRTGSKLGISPLMLAAMNGHTAAVKLLLDMGSDINAQIETNRNTALTLACFQGRHEVVALLLERKANVEHRAKTGLTPLMEAASGGYVEVGRVLLEKGADVNAPPVPSSRDTALTIASDKGHVRFVELLISKSAQVEVKNKKGNSPMWLAANGGHLQVVELLYKHGANIDSQDNRKVSCLMAAFRKGHLKTVTWMVDRVNQFPSDQEMTRYISTINDKDLLDKCQACMKIIRAAKDEQAEKANEFATILLEELDMEKSREESKKMAAARRKERKKNKKLQKIFEKRKQQENENNMEDADEGKNEEDVDEEYQPMCSKEKKDVKGISKKNIAENVNRRNNLDNEEGDSGIDANSLGSCSSNDVKVSSTDRQKDKKNKKQSLIGETSKSASPTKRESRSTEKFTETKASKKKKKKEENEKDSTKDEKLMSTLKDSNKSSAKTCKNKTSSEPTSKVIVKQDKLKQQNEEKHILNEEKKKNKKENTTVVFEASQSKNTNYEKDDFETVTSEHHKKKKQMLYNHEDSTIITSSNVSSTVSFTNVKSGTAISSTGKSFANGKQNGKRGEEEWKEVVRKCLSPTYRVKKVSVPLTAISRVIGRGGCNINAIRATTNAHIEIEKQSKGQGERIITIKGSIENTKQAHSLIAALIEDPEMDITQLLPKSAKAATANASWEKSNANVKSKVTMASTATSSTKSMPNAQHSVTTISSVSGFPKTVASTPISASGIVSSCGYAPTLRTSLITRPTTPKMSSVTFAAFDKKPNQVIITTMVSSSCTSVPITSTKTTMSYTNAIMMSSGKGPAKNSVPTSTITATTVVSQTFAAKVSETITKEKEPIMKPPIAPPPPTSTSIFIRPPPTASAPPTLPVSQSKQPFSIQTPSSNLSNVVTQPLPPLPSQLSQQLSHPPPPLPSSITSSNQQSKIAELQITNLNMEEPSPVSAASEYSLFNDTFSKVTQQSMWGRDNSDESSSQKGMNFASVVTASGSPSSSVGSANTHAKFLDTEPPIQVDASKAPGYRGASMCSPNLQKPPPSIRSSVPSNITSLSPSVSLAFSNAANSIVEQIPSSVAAPIARPTSVPSSMDVTHTYTPRSLFHEKTPALFARDQPNASILKMVQSTVSNDNTNLLSPYHSLSYSQPQVTTTVSMSRLNPRAPDFSTTIKPTMSMPATQLPPTHQPPPIFNQQSLTANFLSSQLPPTIMANSNMMSFPVNKFGQQASQRADPSQAQWSLMNATAQNANYSQNDLMNFATPTTLNNLIHGQNNDMLSGLENGPLAGTSLNISPNSSASLIAAGLRNEERKLPPKPIGTERAWRTERERNLPIEQDPNSWMIEQKLSWNQQMFRNSAQSAVTSVPTPAPAAAPYSCLPQVSDDIRPPILDSAVYQNDHFNGIMQNTVLPNTLPPLLPHMNISQVGSGHILQSFNQDITHPDAFKMETGWDPNRLCMSDITLSADKSHPQQSSQPHNWPLTWNQ